MRRFPLVAQVLLISALLALAGCTLPLPAPAQTPAPSAEHDLGQLAYVREGNIWLKRLPDGAPRQITNDGFNTEPTWSPSGQWLAFRKLDSQLWLYALATGRAEVLDQGAPVNDFAWSPADDVLAYVVGSGVLHLRTFVAGSAEPAVLLDPSASSAPSWVHWSPDGHWLAYTWMGETPAGEFRQEVRVQSAAGSEPKVLLTAGFEDPGLQLAGWTPSGRNLLLAQGPRMVDSSLPDALDLRLLPTDSPQTHADDLELIVGAASWQFAFDIASPPVGSIWAAKDALAIVVGSGPAWTQKRIEIDGRPITPADQAAIQPAWAPDARFLAYASMPDPGNIPFEQASQSLRARRIWVVDASGQTSPRQITEDPTYRDESPRWSAAGDSLIFARLDADNRPSIWLIPALGGQPQQIVEQISLPVRYDDLYLQLEWDKSFDWHPG